jgi:hypothetical protein
MPARLPGEDLRERLLLPLVRAATLEKETDS